MKRISFLLLSIAICISSAWALNVPVPSAPDNGLTGAYSRQTFRWSTVSGAGNYELQVDTTLRFNSPLLVQETTTGTSIKLYDLHFGAHYYWRVRALSSSEVASDWSAIQDLTTLTKTALTSPNDTDPTARYYPKQSLKFKNNLGCVSYRIQCDTTPLFTSPFCDERWSFIRNEESGDRTNEVSDMPLGHFIYWRVKFYNMNDSTQWSDVGMFHTLKKATITSPKDLTTAYTQQTFRWEYQRGLNSVIIEIDTTSSFNSPALRKITDNASSSENAYSTVSNLYFGKTHYWRMKSFHKRDTTEWSDTLSFKTYNSCTLSTPSDSATNRLVTGKLNWNYDRGISRYQVQLDTVPTFDSPFMINVMESASDNSSAYYSYSDLYFGKTYFWRVRECHQLDTSRWSPTRCFTTYRHCNLNTAPSDSAVGIITSPNVYFNYTSGISRYQMQLDTTPEFNSPELQTVMESASSSSNAYHTYYDLLFGTTYYRRVRECHSRDTSDWSPTRSFTTYYRGGFGSTPADGATGVSVTPRLYYAYRSYIDSCRIQIDTTLSFDSPLLQTLIERESSGSSYCYLNPTQLLYGTTYYWRTQDIHSRDRSDWAIPRSFTTTYQLPTPTLSEPDNHAAVCTDSAAVFSWNACADATAYILQISIDGQFTQIVHQETVENATSASVVFLLTDQVLYWRICAINDQGRSPWSQIWSIGTHGGGIATPTEVVTDVPHHPTKYIRDGQLYILRDDVRYNALGQKMN